MSFFFFLLFRHLAVLSCCWKEMVQPAPIQESASPKKSTPAWVTIHRNWKHRAHCRTCRQLSWWGPFGWLEPLPGSSPGLKVSFGSPYSFDMVEKERPNVWAVVGTSWSLWVISWAQERVCRMEGSPLGTPRDSHTFSNPLSIIQTLLIVHLELPPKHKVFVPEKSATQQSAHLGSPHGPTDLQTQCTQATLRGSTRTSKHSARRYNKYCSSQAETDHA